MAEEQAEHSHEQKEERPGDLARGAPCGPQPEPDETPAGKPAASATVTSAPAQLSPPMPAKIDYQPRPPLRSLSEPPQEPHRRIPIVPPGPFEPDQEESPPLNLDEPALDDPNQPE